MADDFEAPLLALQKRIDELAAFPGDSVKEQEARRLRQELAESRRRIYAALTPWQKTQVARHPNRPYTLDYIGALFTEFTELHGDRRFGDDPALVAGFALYKERPVAVVGHQKGRDTKQKIYRNFGMPKPEGYRKALRVMQLAAKFGRPIISFVDTPGRLPRPRRRGARPGGGDRLQPARDGAAADADHRERDGRGRQRGSARGRGRRPRQHARALDLLGDHAGGLRRHPVARRGARGRGGHGDEDHRPRPQEVRPHRRDHPRAAGRRAHRPRRAVRDLRPRPGSAAPRAVGAVHRRRSSTAATRSSAGWATLGGELLEAP